MTDNNSYDSVVQAIEGLESKGDLFDAEVGIIDGVATLSDSDFTRLKYKLRDNDFTIAEVSDLARVRRARVKEINSAKNDIVRSVFAKSKDVSPYPYREHGNETYLYEQKMVEGEVSEVMTPAFEFVGKISKHEVSELGDVWLLINVKTKSGAVADVRIRARDFSNTNLLISSIYNEIGGVDAIYAGMERHVRPAISKMSDPEQVEIIRLFERTGWTDDGEFICDGIMPDDSVLNIHSQLPFSFDTERSDDNSEVFKGMSALHRLVEFAPKSVIPLITSMFSAPAIKKMGVFAKRFVTFSYGKTGSLKTEVTKTCMCIYGKEFIHDHNLLEWGEGATYTSIRGFAGIACDMPLFVDNYKPQVGRGEAGYVSLANSVVEGRDKLRTNTDGVQKENRIFRTTLFFTGEDLPSSDTASIARTIAIPFPVSKSAWSDEIESAQSLYQYMNHVGRVWIEWLSDSENEDVIKSICEKINSFKRDWIKFFVDMDEEKAENGKRIASNLATLMCVWEMMKKHPYLSMLAESYDDVFKESLVDIANNMAKMTQNSSEVVKLVSGLKEMVSSGNAVIIRNTRQDPDPENRTSDKFIGWADDSGNVYVLMRQAIALYSSRMRDDLNKVGIEKIYEELHQREYTESHGTKVVRLGADNKPKRVVVFKKDVLL